MIRAAIILTIVLVSTAHADRKNAERHFNRGERAYRAQKFLAAAQAFEAAYKELPAPELAFSAAQAYRRQYRVDPSHTEYVELAIKYSELYLKEVKTGGRTGDAADSLDDMKAELRHLEKTGKLGKIKTDSAPVIAVSVEFADRQLAPTKLREIDDARPAQADLPAKVTIDGTVVVPDELNAVKEGDHVIRAEAEGYKPVEKRVKVIAGVPAYEQLVLEPLPAKLAIETEAGATVIIDGRGVGEAPLPPIEVSGGTHVVTVLRSGRKAAAREVTVERAQSAKVSIELEPTLRRRSVKWVAILGVVCVATAATTTGGALYWNAQARDKLELLQKGDQDPQVLADYESARDLRDQSVGGIWLTGGATVAVGLAAAWLYYFDSPSAEGVKVVPTASANAAGAVISGRF